MLNTTIESVSQFICTSTSVGIASVGLAATPTNGIINDSTLLPLSLFLGGIVVTTALTWRAASAKNELVRKLDDFERRLDKLEKSKCCKNKK